MISNEEFEKAYRTDYIAVRQFVCRIGIPFDQADDIVQQTYMSVWDKRSEFRGTCSLRTWAMVIARNYSLDYFRKKLRRQRVMNGDILPIEPFTDISSDIDARNVENKLLCEQLLKKLPAQYAYLLRMRWFVNDECFSDSTNKVRQFRAVQMLRRKLAIVNTESLSLF
jgi:RNA polymerase sigma factor (sigma-70 family)